MEFCTCSSYDPVQLACGHIKCRSCLPRLNDANVRCDDCETSSSTTNNEDRLLNTNRFCDVCETNFDSNVHYERHKMEKQCALKTYGCKEQSDLCSWDKHIQNESHIHALHLYVCENLSCPKNLSLVKHLTEFVTQNDNTKIDTKRNNELDESIDNNILAYQFDAILTTSEIQVEDNDELTDEKRQEVLHNQLIRSDKMENSIQSQIEQINEQQNDSRIDQAQLSSFYEFTSMNRCLLQTELLNVVQSKNGILIWEIKNVSEEIGRSYSCRASPLVSPRFSSLIGQHPLNVKLFLYGDLFGSPNYISIHLVLNPGGNSNVSVPVPVTVCLVDQTNNHQHIIQRINNVDLNKNSVGTILYISQFVQTIDVHKEDSPFVKDDTLYLIIKLHENESNQYNHYPTFVQNALQQISS